MAYLGVFYEHTFTRPKGDSGIKQVYENRKLVFSICTILLISCFFFFSDSEDQHQEIVISGSFKESSGRYFGPYYWAVQGIGQFASQERLQINKMEVIKLRGENGPAGIYSTNDKRIQWMTMEPVPHIRMIFTDDDPITTMIDIEFRHGDEKGMTVTLRVRTTEDKKDCSICKRFEEMIITSPHFPAPQFVLSSPTLITR